MSDPARQQPPSQTPAQSSQPDESAAPAREERRPPTTHGAFHAWEVEQARRRAARDIVEQRIQEAQEEGKFDNLRGTGKPLRLDENIWAGDKAMAYHLLASNDVAPQELERGREIDQELARAEAALRALRHQRDTLLARRHLYASDRRAYNTLRDATERRYAETLRGVNSNILSLNIIAPPALHRRTLDVERRLAAFREEFPRLSED